MKEFGTSPLIFGWRQANHRLVALGFSEEARDRLLGARVEMYLEELAVRRTSKFGELSKSVQHKAMSYVGVETSALQTFNNVRSLILSAAHQLSKSKIKEEVDLLTAMTLVVNFCCFGDLDRGDGRFESFAIYGHGTNPRRRYVPERNPILWWLLRDLSPIGPATFEATRNGKLILSMSKFPRVTLDTSSNLVGRGKLFSAGRLWELGQAGLYAAATNCQYLCRSRPGESFIDFPVIFNGSFQNWQQFLEKLMRCPAIIEHEIRRDWLEEAGLAAPTPYEWETNEQVVS